MILTWKQASSEKTQRTGKDVQIKIKVDSNGESLSFQAGN